MHNKRVVFVLRLLLLMQRINGYAMFRRLAFNFTFTLFYFNGIAVNAAKMSENISYQHTHTHLLTQTLLAQPSIIT